MHSFLGDNIQSLVVQKFMEDLNETVTKENFDHKTHYDFPLSGISFLTDKKDTILSIQLFSGIKDNFGMYTGKIPFQVSFDFSRDMVREKFGSPSHAGGGEEIPGLGICANWDSYTKENCVLHFEYDKNDASIALITLMLPGISPV